MPETTPTITTFGEALAALGTSITSMETAGALMASRTALPTLA
jgi:hypothetical protein